MRIFLLLLSVTAFFISCSDASEKKESKSKKINGVSLVAGPNPIDLVSMIDISNHHGNAVALIPYAFTENGSGKLAYNVDQQWWGETPEGIQVCIDLAKEKKIFSMIKPQIWISHEEHVGDLQHGSDSLWQSFEKDYEKYILEFAALSEKNRLPLFCIGTELDHWVIERPAFWNKLIEKVREVYHGDLTYACNWGNERQIPIWDKLNYIGVDMYAPLSQEKMPTIDSLQRSWNDWGNRFKSLSDSLNKEIIFTEWGYRCDDYCAKNPWSNDRVGEINEKAQAICYQVFLENTYSQDWCMGGFVWKWFPDTNQGIHENDNYSPQGKEAAKVLEKFWK